MTEIMESGYDPARTGCTWPGCNAQETESLDGVCGRRCSEHPPRWERRQAAKLADAGLVDLAVAYLRTFKAAS